MRSEQRLIIPNTISSSSLTTAIFGTVSVGGKVVAIPYDKQVIIQLSRYLSLFFIAVFKTLVSIFLFEIFKLKLDIS